MYVRHTFCQRTPDARYTTHMKHWFRPRDYGWGWRPNTWEGWAVIALWVVGNICLFRYMDAGSHSASDTILSFAPLFVASIVLLIVISARTSDWPSWRWAGHTVQPSTVFRKTLWLLLFIGTAHLAGILGTYFTLDAIPTWYTTLVKPDFSPPNWLFGPVWITLYTLMGIAAFFVWDKRHAKTAGYRALYWYWFQLALNALWTPIFFGTHNIGLALFVIALLCISILATVREFWRVSPWLGIMLIPYLAWVSFASILNYSLWMLN